MFHLLVLVTFTNTLDYWEWVEDVLPRYKEELERIKVYDSVYTSLFMYDYDGNVLHAFCELWRPFTNTLSTFMGEMYISLWDLWMIGGLPIHDSFLLMKLSHQQKN